MPDVDGESVPEVVHALTALGIDPQAVGNLVGDLQDRINRRDQAIERLGDAMAFVREVHLGANRSFVLHDQRCSVCRRFWDAWATLIGLTTSDSLPLGHNRHDLPRR